MVDRIKNRVEELLGGDLFLVEVSVSGGDLEVVVDSDSRVTIEDCVRLSKELEDAVGEEYSLVVGSAGLGTPFKVARQYRNAVGKSVDVVLKTGKKLEAELVAADDDGITVRFFEKQKLEGKKRPEMVEVERRLEFADVKATKEHVEFK